MNPAQLQVITEFTDDLLDIKNVADWPSALNGLQLANPGGVTRIGAAVDAGESTIRKAADHGIDLLLVHHGLYWAGLQPLTGALYRKVALALRTGMAIYSAHLPLDLHAELGNNALLARAIGLQSPEQFFFEKGRYLGLKGTLAMPAVELVRLIAQVVEGPVRLIAGGPADTATVGVVTGGAGAEVGKAAAEGVDTFVTGEGPHHSAILAEELRVNMILAGHYATETFGVKALAACLAKKFALPWEFIDHPTGL